MTDDDNANLAACSLAKNLGYTSTIARVHDSRYLNRLRLDFGRIFNVDHFICPELLAAGEMMQYIASAGSPSVKYFFHGAVQLRTIQVPQTWKQSSQTLSALDIPSGVMIGLIYRKDEVIFPHGSDVILPGDEVTFIGETDAIADLTNYFKISTNVQSIVIAGGSQAAFHLAKQLEKGDYNVRIIEQDYERALFLAEHLPKTTVLHHDALDVQFLHSEKVGQANLFISCTNHDDTNILASMLSKDAGCQDALMILSYQSNFPILQKLGIRNVSSPVMATGDRILSLVLTGNVSTLLSLYDNRAEVIEMTISMNSQVVGIALSDLGPLLPKNFLIAVILNKGRIVIADGKKILSPGDHVILITNPEHIPEVEKLF
jgi:trk system potassium uptake protein TrkA